MRARVAAVPASKSLSRRSRSLWKNAKRRKSSRKNRKSRQRKNAKPRRRSKPDGPESQSSWASARRQSHLGLAVVREQEGIFETSSGRHQDSQLPDGQTE